ncbi:MAG TPA: DegQ family serine endoprotease [Candidatus Binataceae bacterium]|nr:DegQ family serine endoprotease [Candidatus Binataceae bacterium]
MASQLPWTELPADNGRPKAQTLPDFVDLAAKLSPAVVNISTEEAEEGESSDEPEPHKHNPLEDFGEPQHSKSLGSGFIVSKDGYVLTNDHVVDHPSKITVTLQDGTIYIAKLIGHDEKSDIAVLKIAPKRDLPVAPLGNSDDVKVGQWVLAIGNPFGFDHSVTVGIVSAKGRFIPGNYDDFIQTDASINPGNSGGPLINLRGEVIGVNSAIYTRTGSSMGIGFAIPVNMVKQELAQLETAGKVTRGWLGVYIQPITPELAESLGLPDSRGALVAEVLKNGPAKSAGIKRGDVIVAFDNQVITDSRELPLLVGRAPLGEDATLKVIRDKHTLELPLKITESQEQELASAENQDKPDIGGPSPYGLHVKDLSPDLAHELGIDITSGVVVSSVQPGSRADEAGLRARDVIIEVNRQPILDVHSYEKALQEGGRDKIVLLLIKRAEKTEYIALKPEA